MPHLSLQSPSYDILPSWVEGYAHWQTHQGEYQTGSFAFWSEKLRVLESTALGRHLVRSCALVCGASNIDALHLCASSQREQWYDRMCAACNVDILRVHFLLYRRSILVLLKLICAVSQHRQAPGSILSMCHEMLKGPCKWLYGMTIKIPFVIDLICICWYNPVLLSQSSGADAKLVPWADLRSWLDSACTNCVFVSMTWCGPYQPRLRHSYTGFPTCGFKTKSRMEFRKRYST